MNLHQLPATEMAEQVRRRQISPAELVEAHLARIERLNPKLNAFIELRMDEALAEAKAAEKMVEKSDPLGPLHGVPISIKSAIGVAGLKFECGSPTRAGLVAQQDAVLVQRLKKAGAIVLGNTNVPELLMAYHTDNPLYGRTNSPWDPERTPGGSSGGDAAAIAAGLCAAGIGSDGGGSIRVPAHFSGICGLKPTPGRIPGTGHYPPCYGPFTLIGVVGPMARTVEDLQLLFNVIAGYDYADPASSPVPVETLADSQKQKLKIGYYVDDGFNPATEET